MTACYYNDTKCDESGVYSAIRACTEDLVHPASYCKEGISSSWIDGPAWSETISCSC